MIEQERAEQGTEKGKSGCAILCVGEARERVRQAPTPQSAEVSMGTWETQPSTHCPGLFLMSPAPGLQGTASICMLHITKVVLTSVPWVRVVCQRGVKTEESRIIVCFAPPVLLLLISFTTQIYQPSPNLLHPFAPTPYHPQAGA